jgi:hypothetical protein
MNKVDPETHGRDSSEQPKTQGRESAEKSAWETPKMEDVSEQVMAQPYIRFT